jgi:hypothetical protein
MGPILNDFTWQGWLLEIEHLLHSILFWMLTSGYGRTVLVTVLVLLVLYAVVGIHGNVKADDSFNIREDYWR